MEVNNYLPTKVRVLSSSNPDNPEPDILKEALSVELDIDKELVYELKINNQTEELYKYLIIRQCNSLNKYLPFLFETIEDYKVILFPEGLLAKDSFLREMTDTGKIPESDWEKVEIIGWLYQFYIAEEKDRVFNAKKKYKTEEIPYATQLFTPNWIVRYMVQNSLGRYWIESHPEHRDLIKNWEFYLENSSHGPNFEKNQAPYINKELRVEDIKCFDPAMGSGHILVYMFDVLYQIYSKCGYMEREIPKLIIKNNLYGLDIDDRAYQLACFSIVMKAMQYNSRFFRTIEKDGLTLNLASIQETNGLNEKDINFINGENNESHIEQTKRFIQQFRNAKSIGSLIKAKRFNLEFLKQRLEEIKSNPAQDILQIESRNKVIDLLPKLLKQANIMLIEYDILVTNPPYMGNRYMNDELSLYLKNEYPDSKADTFAAFMEVTHYLKPCGFLGMVNQHSWMFISSFERLREKIISQKTIYTMLHLGTRAFEEISGEVVQTTAFVLSNNLSEKVIGEYIRLVDIKDPKEKEQKALEAVNNKNCGYRYSVHGKKFNLIPGTPIAYWVSPKMLKAYTNGILLGDISKPKSGQNTGDNERFLRRWFEVEKNNIAFGISRESLPHTSQKWIPYNKGGEYRKWYGNFEHIINWENDGAEIKEFAVQRNNGKHWSRYIQNIDCLCLEGITWSFIASSKFSMRYLPVGFICDYAGCAIFPLKDDMYSLLGFLNSKTAILYMEALNPTLNFQPGNVANIPIIRTTDDQRNALIKIVDENVKLAKSDWDSFEISWEFKRHPLLKYKGRTLQESFDNWASITENAFFKLKSNEEEINRIFINLYDLQDELTADVEDKDVSIRRADLTREIKSFISYAVGCMFGRFSLDEEGLVFAGGRFDPKRYRKYPVDKDNILPILSGAYFEDDIVSRFIDFVKVTFGEETLEENLELIANSLGKKDEETAKETIRRYFLNDFYKDHVQIYRKRPIYWLFTSGKQKAFNCLIYMHRYDKTTLSRIRTDYLHPLQIRLHAERKSLLEVIEGGGTAKEISNAKKELKQLDLKIDELKAYDELLHHMADMQIEIDLDDGVAVNYAKFNGLLAKLD
jgi:type II restriction/modification system DNA methylase subunit YeeA